MSIAAAAVPGHRHQRVPSHVCLSFRQAAGLILWPCSSSIHDDTVESIKPKGQGGVLCMAWPPSLLRGAGPCTHSWMPKPSARHGQRIRYTVQHCSSISAEPTLGSGRCWQCLFVSIMAPPIRSSIHPFRRTLTNHGPYLVCPQIWCEQRILFCVFGMMRFSRCPGAAGKGWCVGTRQQAVQRRRLARAAPWAGQ